MLLVDDFAQKLRNISQKIIILTQKKFHFLPIIQRNRKDFIFPTTFFSSKEGLFYVIPCWIRYFILILTKQLSFFSCFKRKVPEAEGGNCNE